MAIGVEIEPKKAVDVLREVEKLSKKNDKRLNIYKKKITEIIENIDENDLITHNLKQEVSSIKDRNYITKKDLEREYIEEIKEDIEDIYKKITLINNTIEEINKRTDAIDPTTTLIDDRILNLKEQRYKNKEISKKINVSPSTITYRLKQLDKKGILKKRGIKL